MVYTVQEPYGLYCAGALVYTVQEPQACHDYAT